jgi:hypothetical protein
MVCWLRRLRRAAGRLLRQANDLGIPLAGTIFQSVG